MNKKNALFQNGITIPSRFFLAPINTGFAKEGKPTPELINFHEKRSGKSIGISYIGNVAIAKEYTTNGQTLYFGSKLDAWFDLSNAIEQKKSLAGIQIACNASKITARREWINRDKNQYIETVQSEVKSYSKSTLLEIIDNFKKSISIAVETGFKVIQIHAANGYFLSTMLNPILNQRKDIFGIKKTYILENLIEYTKTKFPNILLDIRLGLEDGIDHKEVEIEHKLLLIDKLIREYDLDIVSIANGMYNIDRRYIYPPKNWGHAYSLDQVSRLAQQYKHLIWNVSGNIWDIRLLNEYPSNISFSIGRPLIADSGFVEKSINASSEINHCKRTGKCHYYSRGKPHITCGVNSELD